MPRYYMHLRNSIDEVLDPEGTIMSPDEIDAAALLAARDCIAADVRNGIVDLRYHIDVHNAADQIVHSLPFTSAVEILS